MDNIEITYPKYRKLIQTSEDITALARSLMSVNRSLSELEIPRIKYNSVTEQLLIELKRLQVQIEENRQAIVDDSVSNISIQKTKS